MKHILTILFSGLLMTSVACSDSNNNSPRPANGDQGGFEQTTPGTIVDEATKAGVFNTLLAAAGAAELVDALNGDGPLTVFAPTDDAFAALPEGTVETLLLPENKKMLQDILLYHVVSGELLAQQAISLAGNNSMVATLWSPMATGWENTKGTLDRLPTGQHGARRWRTIANKTLLLQINYANISSPT